MFILPAAYLGDTRYYSVLLGKRECVIDLGENYVKQTERNRCRILTANGPASLTVNVVKGGSKTKCPMRDMRIDYSKRWQHQHWLSLVSAYRNSPYFDYFTDTFAPFYEKRFEFLADFNLHIMEAVLGILRCGDNMPSISETYIEAGDGDIDLRGEADAVFASSGKLRYSPQPYCQVFSDRYAFVPNLSVIDLLMCEGLDSTELLIRSATL